MYYKYDKTTNGTVTRSQSKIEFDLGSNNFHLGQYTYDRSASALGNAIPTFTKNGDSRLYFREWEVLLWGENSDDVIKALRDNFTNNKAAIVS
jgi:hypothetical protein